MSRHSSPNCQNVYEFYLDYRHPVLHVPIFEVFRFYGVRKSLKTLIKKILRITRKELASIVWRYNASLSGQMCDTGMTWFDSLALEGKVNFEIHCVHKMANRIYRSREQDKAREPVTSILKMDKIPVVIFAYNRPNLLNNLLTTLVNAELQESFHFILFLDGPRKAEDIPLINESRTIFEMSELQNRTVIAKETNLGLHNSVIYGMNSVFQSYDFAIVLEDDLQASPTALVWFLEEALRLKGDRRYGAVCGYFPDILEEQSSDNFDGTRFHSWGWATWQHVWNQMDFTQQNLLQQVMWADFRRSLFKISPDLLPMVVGQLSGRISSWAIKFIVNGIQLNHIYRFPQSSLFINNGFGQTATHTHSSRSQVNTRRVDSQNLFELERLVRAYYA